ncbi:MAG: Crp/Fnr family transcriptional regulator [Muribaculaceae bacterium]|nr:Crp/Fnr family transcriptional regulator [Muribaculaceae bacterium]
MNFDRKDIDKKDLEEMRALLKKEVGFLPSGPGLDQLLTRAEWLRVDAKYVVIEMGKTCPDVYILKDGIIRVWDFDGEKERTFGFGLPGTIFESKHSFVMHGPSYYQVETCCPSTILRIPEKEFWKTVENDNSFAIFMLHNAYGELYSHEFKESTINNGTARERFEAMLKYRPVILEKVPQKIIASYLGITSEYFSVLKRRFLTGHTDSKL